jgi:periplasmic divalent cation tolerance protein
MSQPLLVITTLPDQASAESLADRLVRDRLAACVNIGAAVTSVYLWEGRQQHDSEVTLTIKTTGQRYPALQDAIVAAHPYELPEVIAVPITAGLPQYLAWIETCTTD